jgi:hypothetical protein
MGELMTADAFLARGHEMDGHEPLGEGNMGVFKDGTDAQGELFGRGPKPPISAR